MEIIKKLKFLNNFYIKNIPAIVKITGNYKTNTEPY
jgi:hypothetical protein